MWSRWHRDEDGVALVFALFSAMVVAGLVVLFVARSVNESGFSRTSRDFETAVHVAEAGAEDVIAMVNGETLVAKKVTTDSATGDPHILPATVTTEAEERQWAVDTALADTGGLLATARGEAYGIRPCDDVNGNGTCENDEVLDMIFGVGFVPDHQGGSERVVKLRITRNLFNPEHALLTDGDLKIGGNAAILDPGCDTSVTDPDDPDYCEADVHVNGDVDVSGSAHEIEGELTYSGSLSGTPNASGGSSASDPEEVPEIRARDFYNRNVTLNADPAGAAVEWYDLCPGGKIYLRAGSYETGTPCDATNPDYPLQWDAAVDTTSFRGWTYKSTNNVWSSTKVEPGMYYVYRADADVNGSAGSGPRSVSIFLEGDPADPEKSGSLDMAGNPDLVSAYPDILFIADRDLKLKGTAGGGAKSTCDPAVETCDTQRYSGFISVYEQLDVSGTVDLTGALVVKDAEDVSRNQNPAVKRETAGVNGTMTLDYDGSLKIDLTGRVTITFWNELRRN